MTEFREREAATAATWASVQNGTCRDPRSQHRCQFRALYRPASIVNAATWRRLAVLILAGLAWGTAAAESPAVAWRADVATAISQLVDCAVRTAAALEDECGDELGRLLEVMTFLPQKVQQDAYLAQRRAADAGTTWAAAWADCLNARHIERYYELLEYTDALEIREALGDRPSDAELRQLKEAVVAHKDGPPPHEACSEIPEFQALRVAETAAHESALRMMEILQARLEDVRPNRKR